MKDEEEQPDFLYHAPEDRDGERNFLPLAFVLAAVLVGALMAVVKVRMPQPVHPRGEGRIYYRNDELIHFQIRQRTPLPLNLPYYADPARQESAAAVEKVVRVEAAPMSAPAFDFLFVAPDSVVLGEADLLALPPVAETAPVEHATIDESPEPQSDGIVPEEQEAPEEEPAGDMEEEVQP